MSTHVAETMQAPLPLLTSEVEEAFGDGRLYLIVDSARPFTRQTADFVGSSEIPLDTRRLLTVIHVISKPAGGEIRGYVRFEGEERLRLRLPCYTGDWPEMDDAVTSRLAASSLDPSSRSPQEKDL